MGLGLGDDAPADGEENEFGNAAQIELFHDVGAMGFDGVDAEIQKVGDVFVGFAFGDELEDFAFARGEQVVGVFGAAAFELADVVVEKDFADCGAEEGFAVGDGVNRFDEVGLGGVL